MSLLWKRYLFISRKKSIYLHLILITLLVSCDSSDNIPIQQVDSQDRLSEIELYLPQQQQPKNTFYFGFDLRASPQEDAAQYLPFLTYLENTTGYHFRLLFTPKNRSTVEELGKNKIQFAAMGALGFLKAQSEYGAISLVRGLNHQNKAKYQSVFVVKPNSKIHNIKDVKGRTLAFGSRNSTQGHLIPRIMLTENGIALNDLHSYSYTGSHQNCAEVVVAGIYDVCGMQDQLANKLVSQKRVRIIHTSNYYPSSGIVVNNSVSAEVMSRVKQALLDFDPQNKHSQDLYHWERTEMPKGFIVAEESDYANLYQWSIQFGFLQENHQQDQAQ